MTHQLQQKFIDRHFAGRGALADERDMRGHLVGCADCRDYYERHLRLAAVDPQAALDRGERLARGLALHARPAPTAAPRRRLFMALGVVGACAVVAMVAGRRPAPDTQARSGIAAPRGQLLAYEMPKGATARQAGAEIRADSALAFAYANVAHRGRLMVFAVDEGRRVYWYHPAWQDPADDPVAVGIERDDAVHELPHAITHRFTGRRLRLFGVFVDRALSAREVEGRVVRAPVDAQGRLRLDIPEADVTAADVALVTGR